MRLLYVGSLFEGSTTLERMRVLEALGFETLPVDINPYIRMVTRLERSVMWRANIGRSIGRLNRDLVKLASCEPFDALWVDKGVWVYPETVEDLRRRSAQHLAIHFTPDPQLLHHRSRHFLKAIPIYDLHVTTKPFEVDLYRDHAARDVLLVLQGYGRQFTPEIGGNNISAEFSSDVCFIGHCESHYAHRLKSVAAVAGDLKLWGPRWPRYAFFHPWAKPYVQGDGIWREQYPQALASSKIALGLLSKRIPETTTTRTFEIPATGTFLLAERTDDHLSLFEEGKEAEFFDSDDEFRDKIQFYLANEGARQKIAAAGWERCVKSSYSAKEQLQRIFVHLGARC